MPAKREAMLSLARLAGRVVLFVERHRRVVGRVGARRARPTDIEGEARRLALRRLDVEPMLTPADLRREFGRRVGGDIERAVGELARGFDRLEIPAAVDVEPLVFVVELIERPGRRSCARWRRRPAPRAIASKARAFAGGEIVGEILLDADHRGLGANRQRDDALDRAAAGFGDVDDDARLQRLDRRRPPAGRWRDRRGPYRRSGPCRGIAPRPDRTAASTRPATKPGWPGSAAPSTACRRMAPVTSSPAAGAP